MIELEFGIFTENIRWDTYFYNFQVIDFIEPLKIKLRLVLCFCQKKKKKAKFKISSKSVLLNCKTRLKKNPQFSEYLVLPIPS